MLVKNEEDRTKNRALWDTKENIRRSWTLAITASLSPTRLKPQKNGARNAVERLKSVEENIMVSGIEGRRQTENHHPEKAECRQSLSAEPFQFCDMGGKHTWKGRAGYGDSSRWMAAVELFSQCLWTGMKGLRLDNSS